MKIFAKSRKVAFLGFHEGNAGQISEWFEQMTGMKIAAYVQTSADLPIEVDAAAENKKRISQRMEYPSGGAFKGLPLVPFSNWPDRLRQMGIDLVLPVDSDNTKRMDALNLSRQYGFELISAIHPTAVILNKALIEPGVWINAGAIIGYKSEVKSGAMVNTGAQIDHHSILESCCQVDPGVVTAGHVTIRAGAHVHTGAVVVNRITIGEGAIVGAGAVVISDVPPFSTVVGVPARVIKTG